MKRATNAEGDVVMDVPLCSKQVNEIEMALRERIETTRKIIEEAEREIDKFPKIFRGSIDECKKNLAYSEQTLAYMEKTAFPEYPR